MRMYFQKSYYVWYHPYCENQMEIFNPELEKRIDNLFDILRNKFKSIKMSPEVPFDFNFSDPSDEAAFLLWSSDGIEI